MEILNAMIQLYLPFILGGLIVAVILLFILCIILFLKVARERKRYDIFMGTSRRPDYNLEMKIDAYFETAKAIEQEYGKLLDMVTDMDAIMSENIQKVGIIRYNPFDEMGGNLCFALALLDAKDNGVVLNSIHSRTGSFTYAKPIEMGVSTYVLSTEELQAIEMAQQNAYRRKAEKVVKVKPKRIFKWKDKPLFEPKSEKQQYDEKEKLEMIGDVTTNEKASIMAEEEIAQQISENTVIIKNEVEMENIKETVKELVKETMQMEKDNQQIETEEKVRRLEEQVLLLTEKKAEENIVKVKPKRIFKWKDKPLFEPKSEKQQYDEKEKLEMIGDVTTNEKASIMAEEEIAQQISENTVIIKNEVEMENIKETVKELVKETMQMEKDNQQIETEEKVRRLEEQVLLLTEKKAEENIVKKYHRPEPFHTEQINIISEIEKISSDTSEKEERNINVLSDSVENIIEQIAQKTEKQQREISQKKPITTIDEEQMVITAEEKKRKTADIN